MPPSPSLFDLDTLQPLLDAARPLVHHNLLGLCAVQQIVLMGQGQLSRSADHWWLSVRVDDQRHWLSEDVTLHQRPPLPIQAAAVNYHDACAQGLVVADGCQFLRQTDLLRPMGAGMRFIASQAFDEETFVQILWKYNCHERIARPIYQDLLAHGTRTTTVQYHLLDRWPDMQQDLKSLGITIERTLPRLRPSAMLDIRAQVAQLQQQFQPQQKRQGPR